MHTLVLFSQGCHTLEEADKRQGSAMQLTILLRCYLFYNCPRDRRAVI